ncbi:MAG: preprotein translocase subunit SecY [Chthonomonadales bacterium]|nr:preprotein translocase subunit SecY [Chthonomonadales bacterium]
MLESLMQAFRIPELKKRIYFNMIMLAIFVLGAHIPVPGIDHNKLEALFGASGFLGLVDVFSGGALRKMTVFAMGITPYINASIIMQMLTLAIPSLEAMSKEGESGRKQIARITRYLTIALAFFQAVGFSVSFRAAATGFLGVIQMVIIMTAGTAFLLWLGEQVTEKGIGNGVSLVIFAGIMTSLPYQSSLIVSSVEGGLVTPLQVLVLIALFIGTIYGIVLITQGTRRIPIQHVKRVVGMRVTPAGSSFLPIKVNTAGVIPIIFAISMVMFPAQILSSIPSKAEWFIRLKGIADTFSPGASWWAMVLYVALIIVFTYFYTAVVMNVQDMADNLKKYGNYIPGIRPGKPTFDYLDRVVSRITLAGAVFLALVATIQYVAPALTGVTAFTLIGGTSLLIVVGVAIETMQAIEAQLLMRNYEGFIKQSGMTA